MAEKIDNMRIALSDKMSVLQVLGCLIKQPLLFTDASYKVKIDDFPERFHRIVFGAVNYLALQGLSAISPIDIDQFLAKYDAQYKIFTENDGLTYIKRCIEMADENKFGYYYGVLKKRSLLARLYEQGFDISDILDVAGADPRKAAEKQAAFDAMTVDDILEHYETKLIGITQEYNENTDMMQCTAGTGLQELKDGYKTVPDMGVPLISPKCTTLFRGQRLKKLYMESSYQGGGKSRRALGEAAHLAIPQYYDTKRQQWINTGLQESVLFISIELDRDELQTPLIAYVSGVPESKILDGKYEGDEEERVDRAIQYISQSKLFLVRIGDFDVEDIENIIRQYKQQYNVRYVFYDYIATSLKIMAESASKTRMSGLREDQILLMMCTRLKNLCNRLNIHIHTASQLNGDWKSMANVDQNVLRGSKALADKIDVGVILLPVRDKDMGVIEAYAAKGFTTLPNMVLHIYKVRKGKAHGIRLYCYFDYATCRMEDCFATDQEGVFCEITDTNVEVVLEQTAEPLPTSKSPIEEFEF